jgi:hypothetical protein
MREALVQWSKLTAVSFDNDPLPLAAWRQDENSVWTREFCMSGSGTVPVSSRSLQSYAVVQQAFVLEERSVSVYGASRQRCLLSRWQT